MRPDAVVDEIDVAAEIRVPRETRVVVAPNVCPLR